MIIRAAEQEELKGEAIRDGVGEAFSRLLVKNQLKGQSSIVAIGEHRLPAGTTYGQRLQHNTEEIFYIMDGKAEVEWEGKKEVINPGDLVHASHGEVLAIANPGPEELRFLGIMLAQKRAGGGMGFLSTGSTPYSRL